MWNKIKNILIFVVIAGLLIVGYVVFMKPSKQEPLVSSSANQSGVATAEPMNDTDKLGQDFLNLLFSVKSINLDATVFDTPTFGSLKDSSIILIPDGSEGRPNPFAPIGAENTLTVNQAAVDLLQGTETVDTLNTPTVPKTPVAPSTEKNPKNPSTPTTPKKAN